MPKDLSSQVWHEIPRKEIPWFPTISADKCIGCELCYLSCGRFVFKIEDDKHHKAVVELPYNCMVGCSTCATICPTEAISFPNRGLIWKLEKEHKIFKVVHQEAKVKREKAAVNIAREEAIRTINENPSRIKIEIAGQFGEKKFLVKLEELLDNRQYDIINLKLDVPTLQGLKQNAPAVMSFELVATENDDLMEFVEEVKSIISLNKLILIKEEQIS